MERNADFFEVAKLLPSVAAVRVVNLLFRKLKRGWYQNIIPTSFIKSFKFFRKDERQKVFESGKPTIKRAKSAEK